MHKVTSNCLPRPLYEHATAWSVFISRIPDAGTFASHQNSFKARFGQTRGQPASCVAARHQNSVVASPVDQRQRSVAGCVSSIRPNPQINASFHHHRWRFAGIIENFASSLRILSSGIAVRSAAVLRRRFLPSHTASGGSRLSL